jgi:hypothetical protein
VLYSIAYNLPFVSCLVWSLRVLRPQMTCEKPWQITEPRFNSALKVVHITLFCHSIAFSIVCQIDYSYELMRCVCVGICRRWMEKNARRRASLYSQYFRILPVAFVVLKRENYFDIVTVLPEENVEVRFPSYCGFVNWQSGFDTWKVRRRFSLPLLPRSCQTQSATYPVLIEGFETEVLWPGCEADECPSTGACLRTLWQVRFLHSVRQHGMVLN